MTPEIPTYSDIEDSPPLPFPPACAWGLFFTGCWWMIANGIEIAGFLFPGLNSLSRLFGGNLSFFLIFSTVFLQVTPALLPRTQADPKVPRPVFPMMLAGYKKVFPFFLAGFAVDMASGRLSGGFRFVPGVLFGVLMAWYGYRVRAISLAGE